MTDVVTVAGDSMIRGVDLVDVAPTAVRWPALGDVVDELMVKVNAEGLQLLGDVGC